MSTVSKHDVREIALERRNSLAPEERTERSLQICERVMSDERFLDARAVHVYVPFRNEVDIEPLMQVAWEMGKEVGMMIVEDDGGSSHCRIEPDTDFETGQLGTFRPLDAEPFDLNSCDLVIVPVVAVDHHCNRIGYGKGYYDQFLTQFPRPTIGVAFDVQVFDSLPSNDLDISLDTIYTESMKIECEE